MYALRGGLLAWQEAGYPIVQAQSNQLSPATDRATALPAGLSESEEHSALPFQPPAHAHTFLSGLVGDYLRRPGPPLRKELTVLFVDIADSTATILTQTPEDALAFVQSFMEVVTEVAIAYCGDVKDYEGDGALLYFESVTEATQAAVMMRDRLSRKHTSSQHPLQARFSLNVGNVIIGVIGSALRRSVALIGPSINLAARLLKQIPPGGIIATAAVVERLRHSAPSLAERFQLWNERLELKGFHNEFVTVFYIP